MSLTKASFSMITGAPINVLDYGAVGDGNTDNTTAFANAISAIAALGGGALYIPRGTYKYTNFLVNCSNVRVYGDGIGVTILEPYGWVDGIRFANGYPSPSAQIVDVGVEYLTINCVNQTAGSPSSDTYGNGINFNACDRYYARFCEVIKHKQQGIVSTYYLVPSGQNAESSGYITDNIIDSTYSSNNASIGVEGSSTNVIVSRNTVSNSVNVGVYLGNLGDYGTAGECIVSDNILNNASGSIGIHVEDVYKNISMVNNKINSFPIGIRCGTTSGAATDTFLISSNMISGFTTQGVLLSPLASGDTNSAIVVGNSLITTTGASTNSQAISSQSGTQIIGNYINSNTVSAISASGTGIVIQSNTCIASTSYSIDVSSTTSAIVIGNYISNDLNLGTTTQATANLGYSTQRWTQNYIGTQQSISNPSANSSPSTGTWAVGDKVWNTVPAASGYIGWVCVTAGTPGTWKQFGAITA